MLRVTPRKTQAFPTNFMVIKVSENRQYPKICRNSAFMENFSPGNYVEKLVFYME